MQEPNYWYFEDKDREFLFDNFGAELAGYFQNTMPLSLKQCKRILELLKDHPDFSYYANYLKEHVKPAKVTYVIHHESEAAFPALESEWDAGLVDDGNCLPVNYETYMKFVKEWEIEEL